MVTFAPLANDADIDGDGLTVTAATQPGHGTVMVNADGTLTYSPATDFFGTDTFTYTVCDGAGGCSQATVTVIVAPVNDAPVSAGVAGIQLVYGNSPSPLQIGEPDGDAYVLTVVAGVLPPGLSLNPDGTWSGAPAAGGVFPVTIRTCDPFGACSTVDLVLTVVVEPRPAFESFTRESLPITGLGAIPALLTGLAMVVVVGGVGATLSLGQRALSMPDPDGPCRRLGQREPTEGHFDVPVAAHRHCRHYHHQAHVHRSPNPAEGPSLAPR